MFTFDRWRALLTKAWGEGVYILPHPTKHDLGIAVSKSGDAIKTYTVSAYGCSCPARGDCKHRALFLFERPALLTLAVEFPVSDEDTTDHECNN